MKHLVKLLVLSTGIGLLTMAAVCQAAETRTSHASSKGTSATSTRSLADVVKRLKSTPPAAHVTLLERIQAAQQTGGGQQ